MLPQAMARSVSAALVAGVRFGESARLRVSDYQVANKSAFVAASKSGKAHHIPGSVGGIDLSNDCPMVAPSTRRHFDKT